MTIPKPNIAIFGFSFDVFKISFLGQTETSSQNKPPFWPGRKCGCLGYRGCFFSNFYKSDLSIFAFSQIRKVGCLKSEIFKHPSCRYLPIVRAYSQIRKLGFQKYEIYKHSSFRYSPIAKYDQDDQHQNEVRATSSRI